jgi:uncharacterized protein (TIGR03118 family)
MHEPKDTGCDNTLVCTRNGSCRGGENVKLDAAAAKDSGLSWAFVKQKNLVSNVCSEAKFFDKLLVNPWGAVVDCKQNTMYVVNNGTSVMMQYSLSDQGMPLPGWLPVVTPASPSGLVANTNAKGGFVISNGGKSAPAQLIVVTEFGFIAGYNPGINSKSFVLFNYAQTLQVRNYKGACMLHGNLFVADFFNGTINKYDGDMNLVLTIPAPDYRILNGFSPFNVAAICGQLFVAFAKKNSDGSDSVAGTGAGFIDVYNGATGKLIVQLIQSDRLNAPWGMVELVGGKVQSSGRKHRHRQPLIAVGNFGDGQINLFDASKGTFISTVRRAPLLDKDGKACTGPSSLSVPGLWSLLTAPGQKGVYFTAGPDDEKNGLIGRLVPVESCSEEIVSSETTGSVVSSSHCSKTATATSSSKSSSKSGSSSTSRSKSSVSRCRGRRS